MDGLYYDILLHMSIHIKVESWNCCGLLEHVRYRSVVQIFWMNLQQTMQTLSTLMLHFSGIASIG
jgi:hypothetical protein